MGNAARCCPVARSAGHTLAYSRRVFYTLETAGTRHRRLPFVGIPMQSTPPSANDAPVRSVEDLEQVFRRAEKTSDHFRIGAEAEKFGLDAVTLRPVQYSGQNSILSIFERFQRYYGWNPVSEAH